MYTIVRTIKIFLCCALPENGPTLERVPFKRFSNFMKWDDAALILKTYDFGEKPKIITVLSEAHGLHKGLFM
ncbi:hypothetical protein AGMMS49949_08670 [Alphaproteobacteria bacterium]|nr:hypothetical protein AGMMS49949_08670 [Alphaproteobacteria bacterium]GHS99721.1 hypothetical protein AGMMS50296_7970 [Alphaproteobacteria bacterium]